MTQDVQRETRGWKTGDLLEPGGMDLVVAVVVQRLQVLGAQAVARARVVVSAKLKVRVDAFVGHTLDKEGDGEDTIDLLFAFWRLRLYRVHLRHPPGYGIELDGAPPASALEESVPPHLQLGHGVPAQRQPPQEVAIALLDVLKF